MEAPRSHSLLPKDALLSFRDFERLCDDPNFHVQIHPFRLTNGEKDCSRKIQGRVCIVRKVPEKRQTGHLEAAELAS